MEGMTVLDFDMLCSTVALQAQGKWRKLDDDGEEEGGEVGGVFRMWEGELLDCFEDRRISVESAWFVLPNTHSLLKFVFLPADMNCNVLLS